MASIQPYVISSFLLLLLLSTSTSAAPADPTLRFSASASQPVSHAVHTFPFRSAAHSSKRTLVVSLDARLRAPHRAVQHFSFLRVMHPGSNTPLLSLEWRRDSRNPEGAFFHVHRMAGGPLEVATRCRYDATGGQTHSFVFVLARNGDNGGDGDEDEDEDEKDCPDKSKKVLQMLADKQFITCVHCRRRVAIPVGSAVQQRGLRIETGIQMKKVAGSGARKAGAELEVENLRVV